MDLYSKTSLSELYDSLGGKITEGKLEFTTDHTTGSLFAKSSIALNGLNAKVIKIFVDNFGVIPEGKSKVQVKMLGRLLMKFLFYENDLRNLCKFISVR